MADELELKKIVGQIAAAYFGNSHVTPAEIATVINQIASSMAAVGAAEAPEAAVEAAVQTKLTPAQIRRSITRDAVISFEDNKPYKTMRRHLASRGLTPDEYRSKWGLPRDYPMVAPAYSETRSNLAKERGLGGRPRSAPAQSPTPPEAEAAPSGAQRKPRAARGASARAAAAAAAPAPSVQGSQASSDGKGVTPRRRGPAARTRRTKKP